MLKTVEKARKAFSLPEMSGEVGLFRTQPENNLLGVNDDWSAIQIWLKNKFGNKKNSKQQYLLQAERLLLWSLTEKDKPISSLNIEDFKEYFRFLDNPMPREKWCMPKGGGQKRWDKDWRPFKGALSDSAKETAIHAINTMLNYWKEYGYIKANMLNMIDLSGYKKARDIQKLTLFERTLSKEEWSAIMKAVDVMPTDTRENRLKKSRINFLLKTLLVTALRREEVAEIRWSHIRCERDVWRLYVVGKGDKYAKITLPDGYIALANNYRAELGLLNLKSKDNEDIPVFTKLTSRKGLSGNTINALIKKICLEASKITESFESKENLKKASAHWIRHTAATVLDDKGVDKELIKTHLRHESSSTTELYIHKNIESIKIALESLVDD